MSSRNGNHHNKKTRTLIIIGGHEDKDGEKIILREVAARLADGKLVVTTVASHQPEGYFEPYRKAFEELGVKEIELLEIRERQDAVEEKALQVLENARGVFFTGGDQLKITSQIESTPVARRIREIYESGGVIAGTSAGASAMCETMMVSGSSDESHKLGDALQMAPGLGFMRDVIIDQHFAERGRMGRLLGAVAHNPRVLGIGIDENTAIVVEDHARFFVLGEGAVYVVDGSAVTYSNIADKRSESALSIYDVKLHVLSHEDQFDLQERRPGVLSRRDAAKIEMKAIEMEAAEVEA